MARMGKLYSKSYGHRRMKTSMKARKFIAREIKRQREEGKPENQSIAIAFSKARRKGYKV
jgi:hypothetical protein